MDIITDKQINDLRTEAGAHSDLEQVAICDRALEGDAAARAECVRVIEDQLAQDDEAWATYQRAKRAAELAELAEEQDAAFLQETEANAALLEATVEVVKPALRALASRVQSAERTWWPDTSCPATEQEWYDWKALRVSGDGAEELYPQANEGEIGGRDLFLDTNGRFVEVKYKGTWSRWQGASQGWTSTYRFPAATEIAVEYFVTDILAAIDEAIAAQLKGKREKATAAALARAEKTRALVTLLRR